MKVIITMECRTIDELLLHLRELRRDIDLLPKQRVFTGKYNEVNSHYSNALSHETSFGKCEVVIKKSRRERADKGCKRIKKVRASK